MDLKFLVAIGFLGLFTVSTVNGQSDCFVVSQNDKGGSIKPVTKLGLYLANQTCTYEITNYLPAGLIFRFSKMDLEVDDSWKPCESNLPSCNDQCDENDWVSLLRLPSRTEVTRRCDQNIPNYVYRTEGAAAVYFHTDGRIQRTGFVLDWEVDADTLPCTSASVLQRSSGVIQSYVRAIDGKYRANEDCRWLIQVPSEYNAIRITFTNMDLDGSCSGSSQTCVCNNDWVDVHDGVNDNAPITTTRCGVNVPSAVYITGNSAYIRFRTDATLQQTGFSLQFEGTNVATTIFTGSTTTASPVIPWPKEQFLDGYWPLDQAQGLKDVSKYLRHCSKDCHGQVDSSNTGPFGYQETSHKGDGRQALMTVDELRPGSSSPISVSVFIHPASKSHGTIVLFGDDNKNHDLEIELIDNGGKPQFKVNTRSGTHGPYDGLTADQWNFISIVINTQPCTLSIYGQHGQLYAADQNVAYCDHLANLNNLHVGVNSTGSALSSSVSLACLNVYSTALTLSDVQRVYESCRAAQSSASCGAPRIPTAPVPVPTSTNPSHGQFPWAANLRVTGDSSYLCSVAVLDQRHLLTAARCFKTYNTPSSFSVHVSDHDRAVTDTHEATYSVESIFLHPDYNPDSKSLNGDVAIVRLTAPINLGNDYVNAICLPEDADSYEILPTTETYYFFGWGQNGRSALVSPTLPRYVAGKVLSSSDCKDVYPYDAVCFQTSNATLNTVPCTGDEGGLLLKVGGTALGKESRLIPVGTFSRRTGNDCTNGLPALFNPITPYLNWINSKLTCNSCATCTGCSSLF